MGGAGAGGAAREEVAGPSEGWHPWHQVRVLIKKERNGAERKRLVISAPVTGGARCGPEPAGLCRPRPSTRGAASPAAGRHARLPPTLSLGLWQGHSGARGAGSRGQSGGVPSHLPLGRVTLDLSLHCEGPRSEKEAQASAPGSAPSPGGSLALRYPGHTSPQLPGSRRGLGGCSLRVWAPWLRSLGPGRGKEADTAGDSSGTLGSGRWSGREQGLGRTVQMRDGGCGPPAFVHGAPCGRAAPWRVPTGLGGCEVPSGAQTSRRHPSRGHRAHAGLLEREWVPWLRGRRGGLRAGRSRRALTKVPARRQLAACAQLCPAPHTHPHPHLSCGHSGRGRGPGSVM